MRPVVISETIQEFDGKRYYKCGRYFQRDGVRLHRVVWEHAFGPIPKGAHIHHKDNDTHNNGSDNLECLEAVVHLRDRHGEESGQRARRFLAKARLAAAKWHGSEAGKKWHAEHFERDIRPLMEKREPATCHECGGGYMVVVAKRKQGKFCSNACRARALRRRRRGR